MKPYAEVIGDPIAQSKSPALHTFWLNVLGLEAEFVATCVTPEQLADHIRRRRADPNWFGCNVTFPHKVSVIQFVDEISPEAARIGAINCVQRNVTYLSDKLVGHNTDVDGVALALPGERFAGKPVCMLGAGGAARAGLVHLAAHARTVRILARSPGKAEALRSVAPFEVFPLDRATEAMAGVAAVVNASTLGMTGAAPMPATLLDGLAEAAPGATALDMVYSPRDTLFLQAARSQGLPTVDGLAMLIGQAKRAFQLFFGAEPPHGYGDALRELLTRV